MRWRETPNGLQVFHTLTHTFTITLLNHFICLCWTFWTFFKLTFNNVFTHIQPNIRWPTDMLLKCYKYSVNYVEVDYQKKRLISCSRTGHQFLLLYANKSLLALNWTRQWREAMESTGTLFLFQSCWILSVLCLYLWLWGQGQFFESTISNLLHHFRTVSLSWVDSLFFLCIHSH